jgi:iron complex transport system permease protein
LLAAAFLTAAAVSVSGIIGFIGLIAPHILRLFFGSDNRTLVPLAALGGAVLLAAADLAGRTLVAVEVPVGVLTTLLGGPFFFYIFRQRAKQMG